MSKMVDKAKLKVRRHHSVHPLNTELLDRLDYAIKSNLAVAASVNGARGAEDIIKRNFHAIDLLAAITTEPSRNRRELPLAPIAHSTESSLTTPPPGCRSRKRDCS